MPEINRSSEPVWVDNHCHLDDEDDVAAILIDAAASGVETLICVGVTVERSRQCLEIASRHDDVHATAGVHPHDASDGVAGLEDLLQEGIERGVLVAVGECGLDYFYEHSPKSDQRAIFASQIQMAHSSGLPLVIHTRDAWEDTFDVLDSEGIPERTVFHCFTGGPQEAEQCLVRGAMLSISGIVTFGSAKELRAAVTAAPIERLMVETDSPYLAPVPFRGKKNRPALVVRVGEEVAALKELPVERVATRTTANARKFYGLDPLHT